VTVSALANRSSGKHGHAIATALARVGAACVLVSGPTQLPDPAGIQVHHVEPAAEMLAACQAALPADIAVCAAAVADWRVANRQEAKVKKTDGTDVPDLKLTPNPDILASLSAAGQGRPSLVIGFAAETENVVENAVAKRKRKGCDWIIANDVSPVTGTFGGDRNSVHLIDGKEPESWPGT